MIQPPTIRNASERGDIFPTVHFHVSGPSGHVLRFLSIKSCVFVLFLFEKICNDKKKTLIHHLSSLIPHLSHLHVVETNAFLLKQNLSIKRTVCH